MGLGLLPKRAKSKTTRPCEHPFKKMPFFYKQFLLNCGHCKFTSNYELLIQSFHGESKREGGLFGASLVIREENPLPPWGRSPQPGEIPVVNWATSGKGEIPGRKLSEILGKRSKQNIMFGQLIAVRC